MSEPRSQSAVCWKLNWPMLQHMTRKRCLPAQKALLGPTTASQAHGSDCAKNLRKPERLLLDSRPRGCATQWQLGLERLEETSAKFRICLLRIRRSWACITLRTQLWPARTERRCRSGKGNMCYVTQIYAVGGRPRRMSEDLG